MSALKPRNRQASSDPLPYVQVDRAVKPKAGQLAGVLKVSRQHALGSLVDFWELCGDPRDLERLAESGCREVVLSADEVRRRFRLASDGLEVDPADLAAIGLLEPRPDGFRVRGMSRYFAPIERRLVHRAQSVAGGKARAAAGRGANGQFAGARAPAGAPAGVGLAARLDNHQPSPQPNTSRTPADDQPEHQPTTSTADSGQRSTPALLLELPVSQKLDRAVGEVFEHWKRVMNHPRAKLDPRRTRAVKARLSEGRSLEDLKRAIDGCARTPHNIGQNERGQRFDDLELICRSASHIERFIENAETPPAPRALRGAVEAVAGSGPITAREVAL